MSKLATCLAVVGFCSLIGCTDDGGIGVDPGFPDLADNDAVSVDRTAPAAPQPLPPNEGLVEFIATHQADSRGLLAHNGVLYWIDESIGGAQVRGVSMENGAWGVLTKLNESPFSMVASGDALFVTSPFAQAIDRVDLATGDITKYVTFSAAPLALAVDRDALYATTTDGRVVKVTDAGNTVEVLASVSEAAVVLAVRGEDVYFGTAGGALHHTVTTPGLGSEKISSQHGFAGDLAMDETHVYWASDIERKLMRVDRFGGAPQAVIEQLYGLTGVAVDSGFVYVTSQGDNAVRRFEPLSVDDTLEIVGTEFRAPASPLLVDGQLFFVAEQAAAIGKLLD
jgi:hypothetical protein